MTRTHSTLTTQHRNQLERQLDNFATFTWRGVPSFTYGAFIISEKRGDLKFYNGPSFSNNYTAPQFQTSSGNLTGISFNTQQLDFKIGVYWVSIKEYQDFLDWLDPYVINYISFSFNKDYSYLVKLAQIEDSPRYIVGYEDNEPRYYTELTLKWDIQGPACARKNLPFEWKYEEILLNGGPNTFSWSSQGPLDVSLPIPFVLNIPLTLADTEDGVKLSYVQGTQDKQGQITWEEKSKEIFNLSLYHLPFNSSATANNFPDTSPIDLEKELKDLTSSDRIIDKIDLRYDSETGLILLMHGDTSELLTLQTTNDSGDFLLKSSTVNKFVWSSRQQKCLRFILEITHGTIHSQATTDKSSKINERLIDMYDRVRII